ncbi:MAG: hypothetical protein H6Q08_762, partial [Acidobacteria bacterium]|nr:hypothetical protein [Acidobacteriota bacterium]
MRRRGLWLALCGVALSWGVSASA